MSSRKEKEHMVEEALCESLPDGFRDMLLQQTLHRVKRRRRSRQAYKCVGALAALLAIGFGFHAIWQKYPSQAPAAPAYELVQTHPFPASAIISSRPLQGNQFATLVSAVDMIHTEEGGYYFRDITDVELLDLVANRSGLLVRVGPKEQRLIFPNEADQRGFPLKQPN